MACLCGDIHNGAVMTYDAFIYVLLRTASDDDQDTFRTAFLADPEAVLEAAGQECNLSNLGSESLTLPSRAETQALLAQYLPDYDGAQSDRHDVLFNWERRPPTSPSP